MGKCTYILAQSCGSSTGGALVMSSHGLSEGSGVRTAGLGCPVGGGKGLGADGSKAFWEIRADTSTLKAGLLRTRHWGQLYFQRLLFLSGFPSHLLVRAHLAYGSKGTREEAQIPCPGGCPFGPWSGDRSGAHTLYRLFWKRQTVTPTHLRLGLACSLNRRAGVSVALSPRCHPQRMLTLSGRWEVLAESALSPGALHPSPHPELFFRVTVKNETRGKEGVSCVSKVFITLPQTTVTLLKDRHVLVSPVLFCVCQAATCGCSLSCGLLWPHPGQPCSLQTLLAVGSREEEVVRIAVDGVMPSRMNMGVC